MMNQLKELDGRSIANYNKIIEEKLEKEDIPAGLMLVPVRAGLSVKDRVVVSRDKKVEIEEWSIRSVPDLDEFVSGFSDLTREGITSFSEKLGIDSSVIEKAALRTRVLVDDLEQERGIFLDNIDAIRLVGEVLPERVIGGILHPKGKGYRVEYLSCYGVFPVEGRMVPIRTFAAHTYHNEASFPEIFPVVLLLSAVEQEKEDFLSKLEIASENGKA